MQSKNVIRRQSKHISLTYCFYNLIVGHNYINYINIYIYILKMKKKFGMYHVLLFIYYVILLLLQFNVKIINAMNNNEKKYIIDKILDVSIQPKKKD